MNDPIGQAIYDYYFKGKAPDIQVNTNYTEDETISPSWFFREETEMPSVERKALKLCKGKILDVGSGAGSHALALQNAGADVTALEISEKAAKVIRDRGVRKVIVKDLYELKNDMFDTIIVLMNGTGLGGTVEGLEKMLLHLKKLLHPGGQILIDSSDIRYLFQEEDGSMWMELTSDRYYGEMDYEVIYKKEKSSFSWLFVDQDTFQDIASLAGFKFDVVATGEHFDYLARLAFDEYKDSFAE